MANYISISGLVQVDPSHLNGNTGVLERIAALGTPTQFVLKKEAKVEIVYSEDGRGTFLRYTSKTAEQIAENANGAENIQTELEARGKNMRDAEAMMRSAIAFELARYAAAAEMSPHAEETVPIGKDLSDLVE